MRKKGEGPTVKPKFCLELKEVNSKEIGYVVEKEFRDCLQAAGIEIVIVENCRKAHSKTMRDEWAEFE